MTTRKYRDDSRSLLAQARDELARGDVRQASEKGWGAAAQILKAVAEQRGWDQRSPPAFFTHRQPASLRAWRRRSLSRVSGGRGSARELLRGHAGRGGRRPGPAGRGAAAGQSGAAGAGLNRRHTDTENRSANHGQCHDLRLRPDHRLPAVR